MEPWFDIQTAGRMGGIIGSGIGMLGALIGCTSTYFVNKGWKKPVYAMFILGIAVGIGMLITGIAALFLKQPYHVWYCFILPGALVTILFPSLLPVVHKRFTAHEMKKMQAEDL